MCGIAGIYAYAGSSSPVNRNELVRIRDHMTRRGPDGEGMWIDSAQRVGLAHRRLSIIDLSKAGTQPMMSGDSRYVITFNGEIYNYKTLRQELQTKQYHFCSQSDTEVLLHLYDLKGVQMVNDLRGMFAFAIWDRQKKTLFLARDPYGIKPLYYTRQGKCFRFASQVKSLLAGGAIERNIDPAGLTGFYLFGSVPEPFTMWQGIKALPAGSTMLVNCSGASLPETYFSLASTYVHTGQDVAKDRTSAEMQESVREALLDSVHHHLVADVPVGAFLSAGIDSGALVGLMRDAGQADIRTITLSFDEFSGTHSDETVLAEQTAQLYGTEHTTRIVTEDEFNNDLPHILEAMDQPSIDGINTWFVSKAAREAGLKVAISGLGGDELFGGYAHFQTLPNWVRLFSIPSSIPRLGQTLRRLAVLAGIEKFGISPKAAGLVEYAGTYPGAWLIRRGLFMPWEIQNLLGPEIAAEGLRRLKPLQLLTNCLNPMPTSAFGKVATLEASFYMRNQLLRDSDWAGMAHSLEIRVPLVDSVLFSNLASLSANQSFVSKRMLAQSPTVPLPETIISRQKTGFSIPVHRWMQSVSKTHQNPAKETISRSRKWATKIVSNFTYDINV